MYNNRDCADQKLILIGIIFLHISTGVASAAVILDGSLGSSGNLAGPNIIIPDTAGRTAGNNLFHSFSEFSIGSTESATFTGPANIDNILSRVTGGEQSNISGRLASDIPGANLYFLNPAGVMFGPDASLDVKGGFHISTADYIRMKDGSRFSGGTSSTEDIQLTAALPEAFGFLNNNPAGISIDRSDMSVPADETLSVIGGKVTIEGQGQRFPSGDNSPYETQLHARGGRINLASTASDGEVSITMEDLDVSSFDELGEVEIRSGALLDVSGNGKGKLLIRAGRLTVDNSLLKANTSRLGAGAIDGRAIDIEVVDLTLSNGALIWTHTFGVSKGGDISINAKGRLEMKGQNSLEAVTAVVATTSGDGNAGMLNLFAGDMWLIAGAQLVGLGLVSINIENNIELSGERQAGIYRRPSMISTKSNASDAGNFSLVAHNLLMENGARIETSSENDGNAGDIVVELSGKLRMIGNSPTSNKVPYIGASTVGRVSDAGTAGKISITADSIELTDGARIISKTAGVGAGREIHLFTRTLSLSGVNGEARTEINTTASKTGPAGDIFAKASGRVDISAGARISAESTSTGSGGDIEISAPVVVIFNKGSIETSAEAADGGNITITASNLVDLDRSSSITTSVGSGTGNGGLINLDPKFVILSDSEITAKARDGDAGDIIAPNGLLIASSDSVLNVNSERGNDGIIVVKGTTEDINSKLTNPHIVFLDAAKVLATPCADRSGAEVIGLSSPKYQKLPNSPYALRTHLPISINTVPVENNHVKTSLTIDLESGFVQPKCKY